MVPGEASHFRIIYLFYSDLKYFWFYEAPNCTPKVGKNTQSLIYILTLAPLVQFTGQKPVGCANNSKGIDYLLVTAWRQKCESSTYLMITLAKPTPRRQYIERQFDLPW